MTNNIKYQKKIKNIQRMMLTWAGARPGENRDLPDDWKPNFKWLLQKESR